MSELPRETRRPSGRKDFPVWRSFLPSSKTEHQSKSQNDRGGIKSEDCGFRTSFRFSINAHWRRCIFLGIAVFAAVEHSRRGSEEKAGIAADARIGNVLSAPNVNRKSLVWLGLAPVNIGERRQQQHGIRLHAPERGVDARLVRDIDLDAPRIGGSRAAAREYFKRVSKSPRCVGAEESLRADYKYPFLIHECSSPSQPRMHTA